MVAHQAIGVESPAEAFDHRAEDRQRGLQVGIVQEDVPLSVTAGDGVIKSAGVFDAMRGGPWEELGPTPVRNKTCLSLLQSIRD
jgi:hypothetical protein